MLAVAETFRGFADDGDEIDGPLDAGGLAEEEPEQARDQAIRISDVGVVRSPQT